MSSSFDVCIRGGGVIGRTLALRLARERLRVALLIKPATASSAGEDVRAYALNHASRQLLKSLKAWPEGLTVTPVSKMEICSDGGAALNFAAQDTTADALAWIVDVPALQQRLTQAVDFQPQIELVEKPPQAALHIVCEGQQSASRDEFGVDWTVKSYSQKAVAARLTSTQAHLGIARQWFSNGEILALLPTAGGEGNSVALVWSVSAERADVLQQLSPEAFCAALQTTCGDAAGMLTLRSQRSSWPLTLSTAQHWVGPGWALAGDAAHTVHPLAGQGLNLGLADVAVLADVLAKRENWRELGDEKLLRRYERARKAEVATMATVTDGLHNLFAQTDVRWQTLRDWGLRKFSRSGPLKAWVVRQAAAAGRGF